jgi:nucleotide-binding universal stress UspA family protein
MRILVCVDGEPHTSGAIERAIALACEESAELIGLHVIDEWLRQFSSEIYAQGRKEYLEWVDQCLEEKASAVREAFTAQCHAQSVKARFVLRDGEPLVEILTVARELKPDLVLVGSKSLRGLDRYRSGKLPRRLTNKLAHTAQVISIENPSQFGSYGVAMNSSEAPSN